MASSCADSNDQQQGVTLPADEIFRVLRVRTDFYRHRQEHHNILRGQSGFTDHSKVMGAGVRYAGDDTALTFGQNGQHPYEANITGNFAFSMFWTDPECTISRLAFQVTGPTPAHEAANGKITSGPAQRQLFMGIELDSTMENATVREIYLNGEPAPVTRQNVRRLLDTVAMAMDDLQANGQINFNAHLLRTQPTQDVRHIRARMARRKLTL